MAVLLHILAHPMPEQSQTVMIARAFLDAYRTAHPQDEIREVDLYHTGVPHLTEAHLSAISKKSDSEPCTPEEEAAWDEFMTVISQFMAAEKYVITTPMWNQGVPSILKAYIDHLVFAGYTFRYTGPGAMEGLLGGRKMVIINTRGGVYSMPPMSEDEMCVRYLSNIFDMLGIEITDTIIAEGLALVGKHQRDRILQPAVERAREVARRF